MYLTNGIPLIDMPETVNHENLPQTVQKMGVGMNNQIGAQNIVNTRVFGEDGVISKLERLSEKVETNRLVLFSLIGTLTIVAIGVGMKLVGGP